MGLATRTWSVPEELQYKLRVLSEGAEGPALRERARIVLMTASGLTADGISAELGVVPLTVYKWRRRFQELGIEGLKDLPRPGQPRKLTGDKMEEILRVTREDVPGDATRWSIRRVAQAVQATEYQVRSVWEESDVNVERSRLLQLTHEMRSSGPDLELRAVRIAPPFCMALISVGTARTSEQCGVAPEFLPKRRTAWDRRLSSDSFFRAFDVAKGAGIPSVDRCALAREFGVELRGHMVDDRMHHVVCSSHDSLAQLIEEGLPATPDVQVHILPSASLFLNLLEDLGGLAEVRARRRNVALNVFELRAHVREFVEHSVPSSGEFKWCARVERSARNSDWYQLRPALRAATSASSHQGTAGWHSCRSPGVARNTTGQSI